MFLWDYFSYNVALSSNTVLNKIQGPVLERFLRQIVVVALFTLRWATSTICRKNLFKRAHTQDMVLQVKTSKFLPHYLTYMLKLVNTFSKWYLISVYLHIDVTIVVLFCSTQIVGCQKGLNSRRRQHLKSCQRTWDKPRNLLILTDVTKSSTNHIEIL